MSNIDLSFCIPTYNRAEIVFKLVKDILACCDQAIEVVVLDNGSTDDTLKILGSIKDERLIVYTNGENKGGLYNVINVINKAKGKYLVFSTDKDHTNFNEITKFRLFLLQHSDLAVGYCTFNSESKIEYEIFPKGYKAVKNIAYQGRHPTGYFFNNALLKSIHHVERFSDFKIVDQFPFEFIFAELCLMGAGAIYQRPIFSLESEEMAAKYKTFNSNEKSKEAFFSPEARLKVAINYTKHIRTLQLTLQEKELLIVDVFVRQLASATNGYKSLLKNQKLCTHYYIKERDIKIIELFSIGLNFYKKFVSEVIAIDKVARVKQLKFNINFVLILCNKLFRRIVNVYR
jgi:glycosyltransferase involved in cell wall biosynthesis